MSFIFQSASVSEHLMSFNVITYQLITLITLIIKPAKTGILALFILALFTLSSP
ncbi:hypothetical protein AB6D20_027885 (plasmid) [Vibrio splendidus]